MPRLSPRWRKFLAECLLGELSMTGSCRQTATRRGRLRVLHADEDGKISFISIFTMLAFLLLICLVANSGVLVKQKIELQNAADATAYSTALWQARSLNAVTTTNHLMGELTALTVILDGFGGKMLGQSSGEEYALSKDWNKFLKERLNEKPWVSEKFQSPIAKIVSPIDKRLVETVYNLLATDQGRHAAGAMLFDSQITLKLVTSVIFIGKLVANVLVDVGALLQKAGPLAAVGVLIETAGIVIHGFLTIEMIDVGLAWARLKAVESAIETINVAGVRSSLQETVIPALSIYADTVVGAGGAGQAGSLLNLAARQTQEELKTAHRLKSADTFPAWNRLVLPLAKEPPPMTSQQNNPGAQLGEWRQPQSQWSGNLTSAKLKKLRGFLNFVGGKADEFLSKINRIVRPLKKAADNWKRATGRTSRLTKFIDKGVGAATAIASSLNAISEFRALEKRSPKNEVSEENPSVIHRDETYRLPEFYWEAESRTQWVRAAYPYVDDLRAPILKLLSGGDFRYSDAATFYVHWTNRYTLANSYEIRANGASGPHMYLLTEATPENKGRSEPWVTATDLAEELFCHLAIVTREPIPLIGDKSVYAHAAREPYLAIAQGMVYNANGRSDQPGNLELQPDNGWDTLNWARPVQAFEWGDHNPSRHNNFSYLSVFQQHNNGARTQVKLNWQSKLTPITSAMLRRAARGADIDLQFYEQHDELVSH